MAQMTPLRRRLIDDMTVRNLSPATQQILRLRRGEVQSLLDRVAGSTGGGGGPRLPDHLVGLGLSWSHINQVSCALRFFFGVTLGRQDAIAHIVRAKEPKKLPVVLSGEEIERFLEAVPRDPLGHRSRALAARASSPGVSDYSAYGSTCAAIRRSGRSCSTTPIPRSSGYLAVGDAGHSQHRLRRVLRPLAGGREHLPPALVPHERDERVMGLVYGQYDAKPHGFAARRLPLHNMMLPHRPRPRGVRDCQQRRLKPHSSRAPWPSCSRPASRSVSPPMPPVSSSCSGTKASMAAS